MSDPSFAIMVCAHGAESAVKTQLANTGWRLAFSRPGLVTAKHDAAMQVPPSGPFIRTSMTSIGQVQGSTASSIDESTAENGQIMLDDLVRLIDESPLVKRRGGKPFEALHIFPRDRHPIGKFDFEPGIDEVSALVAESMHPALAARIAQDRPNQVVDRWQDVLDVVLVAPDHWLIGMHQASHIHGTWPGGVQPIEPRYEPISRAYFKAAESVAFGEFNLQPGQTAIEIGSAPGGACGFLLECGLNVIGIDPAEMDPRIARHRRFRHLRARGGDLKRSIFSGADWLFVDSNVRPDQTLTTVENVVMHRSRTIQGAAITLKLGGYHNIEQIDRWLDRMATWGASETRVKQLARNKVEICVALKF